MAIASEIIAGLASVDSLDAGRDVLARHLDVIGLRHFAYLDLAHAPRPDVAGGPTSYAKATTTYSVAWRERYVAEGYLLVDPVVKAGCARRTPVDWETLVPDAAAQRAGFFEEARAHGVGENGLTIPVRSRSGGLAMFSVSSDLPARAWRRQRRIALDTVMIVSFYFDVWASALECDRRRRAVGDLSHIALECLRWCAAGLTPSAIADRLCMSDSAVEALLAQTCRELDAVNTVQAVARAVHYGAIDPW